MRRALILLAFLATTARAAELPVAVWYGGGKVRAPMLERDPASHREEWRKDLQQIRATGFSAIRCWIDWASAEPREGEYHFETLDVLTDLAHETGLKVIVQVYIDSAPDWVGKKFPDSHFVSISGEVMPSESAPGYCFDHPGVHAAVLRLFTALAGHLGKRPAFLGFDVWSEPHVINWAEARAAWNDERGRAKEIIPGYGLNEVCGCRETAVQSTPNGKVSIAMTSDFAGLKTGDVLKGSIYQETLTPTTGRAVATFADGSPAIVESAYGAGKMLTIGSFEGLTYETERDETIAKLLRGALDWADVRAPVRATPASIEVRILESGGKRMFFIFNHSAEAAVDASVTSGDFQWRGSMKPNEVIIR